MIKRRKEFFNVALQYKTPAMRLINLASKNAKPLDSFMRSLVDSGGIGIGNKGRLKNRIDVLKNYVMHDAVPYFSFVNMPDFRVADIKAGIFSVPILFINESSMKLEKIIFKTELKCLNIGFVSFPLFELIPRIKQIFHGDHF
jgi:hypothetical protein